MNTVSKHKRRRDRRKAYYEMLTAEIDTPRRFIRRVLRTLDARDGTDVGPDGKPIKADFWRYFADISTTDGAAAQSLHQHAISEVIIRRT